MGCTHISLNRKMLPVKPCVMIMFVLLILLGSLARISRASSIGVCYGLDGDNLPSPEKVAQLLQSESISKVRLFDADSNVLQAFRNTRLEIIVGIKNSEISDIAHSSSAADAWIARNIAYFIPEVNLIGIAVGSEAITSSPTLALLLVPAMKNIYSSLVKSKLHKQIKVSSPVAMGILSKSFPPSAGTFDPVYATSVMKPMLEFLSKTDSFFMINVYPYYAYRNDMEYISLNYALFRKNRGVLDPNTGLQYNNLFDAQLDAIFSAMAKLGYKAVKVVVSETGWPSMGEADEVNIVNLKNAATYTGNLLKHVSSNLGTPLNPGAMIDTYIFELFNEDQRPGVTSNRNWGLFKPDGEKSFDFSFSLDNGWTDSTSNGGSGVIIEVNRTFCVAAAGVRFSKLQVALDWACGEGHVDCSAIQPGQRCYQPDTVASHASYAFNSYYQNNGLDPSACVFSGAAAITTQDPSYGSCVYEGSLIASYATIKTAAELSRGLTLFVTVFLTLAILG